MTLPTGWERPYSPGLLARAQFEAFWRDGFVLIDGVLSYADLQPTLGAIERLVDDLANTLHAAGRIQDRHPEADVYTRLILLEHQFPEASVLLHKDNRMPSELAALWAHPKLLGAVQQLLGGDVVGNPNWNLRTKTPAQEAATVPWHQDNAYADPSCWDMLVVTGWIPFLDATVDTGCLQMVRGSHRAGTTAPHSGAVGDTWYVALDEAAAVRQLGADFERGVVTCEAPLGSVLLFNNLTVHRSLGNTSSRVRWSVDLRWQRPGEPYGGGPKPPIAMVHNGACLDIEWGDWLDIDKKGAQAHEADPLDTTIVGPWLSYWPMPHQNKHTRAWAEVQAAMRGHAVATMPPATH